MVGGSVEFFFLAGLGTASLVFWADVQVPIVFSLFYLGLVLVMGYELSRDVLRASQLVSELQASEAGLRESEARMSLAVDAADFGIWIRDLARNEIWASEKWRELFGFTPAERPGVRRHPGTAAPRRSRRPPAGARDGGRGCGWRPIPDGIPADAAGWRDPMDLVPGPCRVRRRRPAGPDPRRLSRRHRAQARRGGDPPSDAGDRPRRARLDDGPARGVAGTRDQSAARGDPAQRGSGGTLSAAAVTGSRRNPRDPCRYPR